MSKRTELIDVEVRRRVLWVGAEAYPLQNIARAQTIELPPARAAALRRYLTAVLFYAILGAAAAIAINAAPRLNSGQGSNAVHSAAVGLLALVVALFIISTISLVMRWTRRTYYALFVETAGTPHRVLVSTDEKLLRKLVRDIMDAINNPDMNFHYRVENYADLRGAQGVLIGGSSTQHNTFNGR